MTHQKKLNSILNVLLDTHQKRLNKQQIDSRLNFSFICKVVTEVTDDWEVEFLKQRLLSDGYMTMGDFGNVEPPNITQEGIKFIQQGGYVKEMLNQEIEQKIRVETFKKFQYDKWAFLIAILSLITALIALIKK